MRLLIAPPCYQLFDSFFSGFNNYTCLCRSGYTGIDCDITIDPCTANGNPCSNGATCLALQQGRYKCECISGWEGQHCEKNIDDCAENPCLLGSNCTDLVNDFSCSCPPGFTGKVCVCVCLRCGASHSCAKSFVLYSSVAKKKLIFACRNHVSTAPVSTDFSNTNACAIQDGQENRVTSTLWNGEWLKCF